jgi:hypothetical protein
MIGEGLGYAARNAVNNRLTEAADSGLDRRTRCLLMALREALIVALRGVETYLGMPLSIPPKERRL